MLKRGVISDYLPWILIAVALLAIFFISIFFVEEGTYGFIDQIKNLFRWG